MLTARAGSPLRFRWRSGLSSAWSRRRIAWLERAIDAVALGLPCLQRRTTRGTRHRDCCRQPGLRRPSTAGSWPPPRECGVLVSTRHAAITRLARTRVTLSLRTRDSRLATAFPGVHRLQGPSVRSGLAAGQSGAIRACPVCAPAAHSQWPAVRALVVQLSKSDRSSVWSLVFAWVAVSAIAQTQPRHNADRCASERGVHTRRAHCC
jgi:hypothetical protein